MDRKGIIGIVIAVIVLFSWTTWNSRQMAAYQAAQKAQQAEADAKAAAAKAAATPAGTPTAEAPAPGAPATATTPATAANPAPAAPVEEKKETVATPQVAYTFTTNGGGIARAELTGHKSEGESHVELNRFGNTPIGAVT